MSKMNCVWYNYVLYVNCEKIKELELFWWSQVYTFSDGSIKCDNKKLGKTENQKTFNF